MRFVARDAGGSVVATDDYYSLGGGFIAKNDEPEPIAPPAAAVDGWRLFGLGCHHRRRFFGCLVG